MRDFDITGELNVADVLKEQHKEKHEQEQEKQQRITVLEKKAAESFTEHFAANHLLQFFKKYSTVICVLLILLAVLIPRFYIASIPITAAWATAVAETDIRQQATAEISQKYPFLSEIKRNELIVGKTKQQLKQPEIKQSIKQFAKQLSDNFKDPEGNVYLYEADPYYYLRAVEQDIKDMDPGFIVIGQGFTKLMQTLSPNMNTAAALSYLPLLGIILTTIILFFLLKKITTTGIALLSALLFAIHPFVLGQSMIGLVDKQMFNLIFFLGIVAALFYFIRFTSTKSYFKAVLALLITGLLIKTFATVWHGYTLIMAIITGAFLLLIIQKILALKKINITQKNKPYLFVALLLLAFVLLFFYSSELLLYAPRAAQQYLTVFSFESYLGDYFPNGFEGIEELQTLSFSKFTTLVGGNMLLLMLFIGIISISKQLFHQETASAKAFLMTSFLSWFFLFLFLSLSAKRFFLYLLPPAMLFLSIGLISIQTTIYRLLKPYLPEKKFFFHSGVVIFITAVLLLPGAAALRSQYIQIFSITPIVDDAFYNAAMMIREQTPVDANINVWWDKGHALRALSQRETFSAASPEMPMTYWIARSFVETNENKSINIQHLLSCKRSDLYGHFEDFLNTSKSRDKAEEFLLQVSYKNQLSYLLELGIDEKQAKNILNAYLFCNKTTGYILLTEDLLAGFNGIVAMADWDFEAAEAREQIADMDYGQAIDTLKQQYNLTSKEAQELYQRTATLGMIYDLGLQRTQCSQGVELAQCNVLGKINFLINYTSVEVLSKQKPVRFFLAQNNTIIEKHYDDAAYNSTLIVYELNGIYYSILTENRIADTMFIRLLLLEGYGLEHFKQLADIHSIGTKRTVVYEVRFE